MRSNHRFVKVLECILVKFLATVVIEFMIKVVIEFVFPVFENEFSQKIFSGRSSFQDLSQKLHLSKLHIPFGMIVVLYFSAPLG